MMSVKENHALGCDARGIYSGGVVARQKRTDDVIGKCFGLGVKRIREGRGIKQEALAIDVGYGNRSQIAKIETGKTIPSLDKALRLAAILQVTVETFVLIGSRESHLGSEQCLALSVLGPSSPFTFPSVLCTPPSSGTFYYGRQYASLAALASA